MIKTKADLDKAKSEFNKLTASADDYIVKVQNCLAVSDGANIEDAKKDMDRLLETIEKMKRFKEETFTIETKADLDNAKSEFEKLSTQSEEHISAIRNALGSGDGVKRKIKSAMIQLNANVDKMRTLHQMLKDTENSNIPTEELEPSKKTLENDFRDELIIKMRTLVLCIDGIDQMAETGICCDDRHLALGEAYRDLTRTLKDFLPENMVLRS